MVSGGSGACAVMPGSPTRHPTRPPYRMPDREEIELPFPAPMLRDGHVLRLIAVDRAIHVIVLTTLAIVLYTFAKHDATLHRDYVNIISDLSGTTPGESQVRGVLGYLDEPSSTRLLVSSSWGSWSPPTPPSRPRRWLASGFPALGRVPDTAGHRRAHFYRDL